MYSKLQNVSKVVLDCRLGPALSCLVADKKLNYNFPTKTTKPSYKVRMGEIKKVGSRKEQAMFEKEDVEKVEDGR